MKFYLNRSTRRRPIVRQPELISDEERKAKAMFTLTKRQRARVFGSDKALNVKKKSNRFVLTSHKDVVYAFLTSQQAMTEYNQASDKYICPPIQIDRNKWNRLYKFYQEWDCIHFPDIENHVVIYTDASVSYNSPLGPSTCYGGIALKVQNNQLVVDYMVRKLETNTIMNVTHAEYLAMKTMYNHYKDHNITFVTDSEYARAIVECTNPEYVKRLMHLHEMDSIEAFHTNPSRLIRCFNVPSHCGSLGNYNVDFLVSTTKVYKQ